MKKISIIDDNTSSCFTLEQALKDDNISIKSAHNGADGLKLVQSENPNLVLLDLNLPDCIGIDLIPHIRSMAPEAVIFMISASTQPQEVVKAIQQGASDYIVKPFEIDILKSKVDSVWDILERKEKVTRVVNHKEETAIVGNSSQTKKLLQEIYLFADCDSNVLIQGESGTGKNLVASCIHEKSLRHPFPFITINCASIPESLLESELFGYEKGAFTGATDTKEGKFEVAEKGTIFLDEISEIPLNMQAKLLRVIQGKEFERLGGLRTKKLDIRIIAATNKDLESEVYKKNFREDLFYRLNVLPLFIRPLRERRSDIPALVDYYFNYYCNKMNKKIESPHKEVVEYLSTLEYPGNIRQLQFMIERAIVMCANGGLTIADFSSSLKNTPSPNQTDSEDVSLGEIEYQRLISALQKFGGNISKIAKYLDISRGTVYSRLKKYGIDIKRQR